MSLVSHVINAQQLGSALASCANSAKDHANHCEENEAATLALDPCCEP